MQSHGKILTALTRYISIISFPSPSYSKHSTFFTLAGEKLGIISKYDEKREGGKTSHKETTYHNNKENQAKQSQIKSSKAKLPATEPFHLRHTLSAYSTDRLVADSHYILLSSLKSNASCNDKSKTIITSIMMCKIDKKHANCKLLISRMESSWQTNR